MEITEEKIKELKPNEVVELFNNTLTQKLKVADGEGMKRGLTLVDTVLDELQVPKVEGQKTSDRAKNALISRAENLTLANKQIEELSKTKGSDSEVVANLKREILENKTRAETLATEKETLIKSFEQEKQDRIKKIEVNSENEMMLKQLSKGNYGEGVTGEIKTSFLNSQIAKIREIYKISKNSDGKLQFHDADGNLKTSGATNAPSNVLDIALLNDSFKNAYSEVKVHTKINIKNNGGNASITKEQYLEQLKTKNIPESEKQKLLIKFAMENK